jgi:2-polyprenyl-3-methyl-5-hydroxy-6-metoxy-1,4-benzoquinol methylase
MAGRCILCQGVLAVRHAGAKDPVSGECFEIHECVACGLGHTQPPPANLLRYYGQEYHGARHSWTSWYRASRRRRLLTRFAPRPGRLLDVGCGDGDFLQSARALGWVVAGTELGPAAARGRAAGLDVRDSLDTLADIAPFHCITLWHSLEHVRDPREMMREVHRLLARGGVAIISVPNASGWQARLFGKWWFHLDVPRHLHHFGERSLRALLHDTGFEILRLNHLELEYDLFGWTQSVENALFPTPNVLFKSLTGRSTTTSRWEVGASLAIGAASTPFAFWATLASALAGQGGTLIAVARARAAEGSLGEPIQAASSAG